MGVFHLFAARFSKYDGSLGKPAHTQRTGALQRGVRLEFKV